MKTWYCTSFFGLALLLDCKKINQASWIRNIISWIGL